MHASAHAQTQTEKCTQFAVPTLKVKKITTAYIEPETCSHTPTHTQSPQYLRIILAKLQK